MPAVASKVGCRVTPADRSQNFHLPRCGAISSLSSTALAGYAVCVVAFWLSVEASERVRSARTAARFAGCGVDRLCFSMMARFNGIVTTTIRQRQLVELQFYKMDSIRTNKLDTVDGSTILNGT